jgi:hypothetical protein
MKIIIETIKHSDQRYPTLGDWQTVRSPNNSEIHIKVSETGIEPYNFLIAIHELVECFLCIDRKITDNQVDAFDNAFVPDERFSEPGNHPAAPYYREHQIAEAIERLLAHELLVNWSIYDRYLEEISQ